MTPNAMAQAWQHFRAGNLAQAEAICTSIAAAEPANVDARYLLGIVCQSQGRLPECIAHYERCLRIKADIAEVHNNLGIAYAQQGRVADALACYREAARLKPTYLEAHNNLGLLLAQEGQINDAIQLFQHALAVNPCYADGLFNLGTTYLRHGEAAQAVRCFQQAMTVRSHHAETLESLGDAFLALNRLDDASDCYQQSLRVRPDNPRAFNNLARVHVLRQNWSEAVACLQQSISHSPGNPLPHRNLGNLYYFRNDLAQALPCFERVLELDPDDKMVRFFVEVLSGAARFTQVPADYLASIYDPSAPQFDRSVVQLGYRSPEFLKTALEPAPPPRSLAVLDLGCGTGLCGLQFREWAQTLIGVDLSPKMLEQARARGVYDELIVGDLFAQVRQWQNRFDLIVASDVMLFFSDLEPVAQAVRQALRPGGRFAFSADLHEGKEEYHLTPYIHFAHSPAYLRKVAATIGMREVCMKQVGPPSVLNQGALGLVVVWSL